MLIYKTYKLNYLWFAETYESFYSGDCASLVFFCLFNIYQKVVPTFQKCHVCFLFKAWPFLNYYYCFCQDVMFSVWVVGPFVCQTFYRITGLIFRKPGGRVQHGPRTNPLNFKCVKNYSKKCIKPVQTHGRSTKIKDQRPNEQYLIMQT